jgi:hypothetical protein
MEDARSHSKDFINSRIFPPHDRDNQIILGQESDAALLVIIFLSDGLAYCVITSGFDSVQVFISTTLRPDNIFGHISPFIEHMIRPDQFICQIFVMIPLISNLNNSYQESHCRNNAVGIGPVDGFNGCSVQSFMLTFGVMGSCMSWFFQGE